MAATVKASRTEPSMATPSISTKIITTTSLTNQLIAGKRLTASHSAIGSNINPARLKNLSENIRTEVAGLQNLSSRIQGNLRNGVGLNGSKSFSSIGGNATLNALNGALKPKLNTGNNGQKSEEKGGSSYDASEDIAADQAQQFSGLMKDTANDVLAGAAALGAIAATSTALPALGVAAAVMTAVGAGAYLGARLGEVYKEVNPLNDNTSSSPFQLKVTPGGFSGSIQVKARPGNATPTGLDQDVVTGVFLTANEAKAFHDTLLKAAGGHKSTPDPLTDGGGMFVSRFDLRELALLDQGGGAAGPKEGGTSFPMGGSPLVGSVSSGGSNSHDSALIGFGGVHPTLAHGLTGSSMAGMATVGLAVQAAIAHL
jgi:hypothetical protein